jgi:hypothetical protein
MKVLPLRNHVTRSTLGKVLALSLLKRDGHKVLVGLGLDALSPAQVNFKDMLLVGGMRMQELKPAEYDLQVSSKHTVKYGARHWTNLHIQSQT